MVGEIGGNDYDLAIFVGNKTIKEAMDMVPQVVQTIKYAVKVAFFLWHSYLFNLFAFAEVYI